MHRPRQKSEHPLDELLRTDRIPHIWCPGCGIGTAFSSCLVALKNNAVDLAKAVMVSGIGCSGRAAGYVRLDSYHTTHGRAIPFATGLKLANPELNVVVFSGDGDLFAIGGNHFIHAARRNMDLTVICVNNFNYGMTGGQAAATTPTMARTTTTPFGNPEPPSTCRSWHSRPGPLTWPAGPSSTPGTSPSPWRKPSYIEALRSSRSLLPVPRATGGETGKNPWTPSSFTRNGPSSETTPIPPRPSWTTNEESPSESSWTWKTYVSRPI